jgi:hypothetical protein
VATKKRKKHREKHDEKAALPNKVENGGTKRRGNQEKNLLKCSMYSIGDFTMSIGFASIVLNLCITSHGDITLSFSQAFTVKVMSITRYSIAS